MPKKTERNQKLDKLLTSRAQTIAKLVPGLKGADRERLLSAVERVLGLALTSEQLKTRMRSALHQAVFGAALAVVEIGYLDEGMETVDEIIARSIGDEAWWSLPPFEMAHLHDVVTTSMLEVALSSPELRRFLLTTQTFAPGFARRVANATSDEL